MRVEGLAALVSVVVASAAAAQETVPGTDEAELAAAQSDFEFGKYRQVLDRAEQRIDRSGLDDAAAAPVAPAGRAGRLQPQADGPGAAAHRRGAAHRPRLRPRPFVYPPPAVAFVEKQRQAMAPELDRIRAERRAQEAAARKAAEERAALTRQAEEERRKLEEMSRQITVRTVEKRSFLVNFVPFGAGQFQQGRVAPGTGFAIAEALLGITSVVAYFAYGSLVETRTFPLDNRFPGTSTVVETGIPANREDEAKVWRALKIGAGLGFYGVYAAGVADAIIHHQDAVVTTRVESPSDRRPRPARASARIGPGPGTVGASVTVRF